MIFIEGLGKYLIKNGVAIIPNDLAICGFSVRSNIVKLNLRPLQILFKLLIALIELELFLLLTNNKNENSVI